jgi:hypothetical protein
MRSAPNQAAGPGLRRVREGVIREIASVTAISVAEQSRPAVGTYTESVMQARFWRFFQSPNNR